MKFDLIVANGDVFIDGSYCAVDVAIRGGKIAAVGDRGVFSDNAENTLDIQGRLLFPGVIDSHFHSRAPSHPERETFATATAAAAAGGVTTIIEMPISEPPTTNGQELNNRAELVDAEAYVNVGFYSSCATLSRNDLESSVKNGALAFKGFLQSVPAGRESEFAGLCLATNAEVFQAFELLSSYSLPAVFHPEDESILKYLRIRLQEEGRRDGLAHAEHRPDIVEAIAVSTLIQLAMKFNVHLHVPHVSSQMTVDMIRDAKRNGVRVTAETCPHYLEFTSTSLERLGPYAVCNPPLKSDSDREALWEGVIDGTIDTVASDHSPFTVAEKERALSDIWLSPPGFPGVEILAPYVIGAALNGKISDSRLNDVLFRKPAAIFGLDDRKGAIRIGADADLMVYDPHVQSVFDHRVLKSRAGGIGKIWDGVAKTGVVCTTILAGSVVFDRGEVIPDRRLGRTIRRNPLQG